MTEIAEQHMVLFSYSKFEKQHKARCHGFEITGMTIQKMVWLSYSKFDNRTWGCSFLKFKMTEMTIHTAHGLFFYILQALGHGFT
jgi:hypothetical protein